MGLRMLAAVESEPANAPPSKSMGKCVISRAL